MRTIKATGHKSIAKVTLNQEDGHYQVFITRTWHPTGDHRLHRRSRPYESRRHYQRIKAALANCKPSRYSSEANIIF